MTLAIGPTRLTYPGLWGLGHVEGNPVTGDIISGLGPRPPIVTPAGVTSSYHGGVDIVAPGGTPIVFPCDEGTVTAEGAAWNGYGNVVIVTTPDGYTLIFAHMREGAHVGLGMVLKRGDIVGLLGTTGASTGDHLHFAVAETPMLIIRDINTFIDIPFWRNPLDFITYVVAAPVHTPATGFDFEGFITNSLRALANYPPNDTNAALLELANRVEYLYTILS